jgi:hypothetical protein
MRTPDGCDQSGGSYYDLGRKVVMGRKKFYSKELREDLIKNKESYTAEF